MTATRTPDVQLQDDRTVQSQTAVLLGQVAGYMAHRTVEMGLSDGLVRALASAPGSTPDELADGLGMDDFYVSVWCQAAFAAGVLEREGAGYRLAEHMETLLLDDSSPAFVGGLYPLVRQPEMFGRFAENLRTGGRLWWDRTSPEWIAGVSATGRPFYSRLIPGGLDRVPGLADRLREGCRIVDSACGAGAGVVRLAQTYPRCEVIGLDGDQHSIDQAEGAVRAAGLADRISLVCTPLEDLALDEPVAAIVNNISMHECRDIDKVTAAVHDALEPGGWFVISDFPFPDTDDGLRSVPGRIMCGIQFFEAQIDDQLLPRPAYDDLLTRHGFNDLGSFTLSPVHAVTHARRPG